MNGRPSIDQGLPSDVAKGSSDIVQAPHLPTPGHEGDQPRCARRDARGHPPPPGVLQKRHAELPADHGRVLGNSRGSHALRHSQGAGRHSHRARSWPSARPTARISETEAQPLPFVGKIISMVPSQEVVTHRQIDLAEDLFLHDHTFGGQVSAVDDTLKPLPVIPMTVAMEIMAETAALLMPGKLLIGMKDIQTYQWIDLERRQTILQISARRRAAGQHEIEVRVHNLGENGEGDAGKGGLALQGIMVFGDADPEPPQVEPFALTSARPPEFTAEEMYIERLMFHGPRFQGVVSLDTLAAEGSWGNSRSCRQITCSARFAASLAHRLCSSGCGRAISGLLAVGVGGDRQCDVSHQIRCLAYIWAHTPSRPKGYLSGADTGRAREIYAVGHRHYPP